MAENWTNKLAASLIMRDAAQQGGRVAQVADRIEDGAQVPSGELPAVHGISRSALQARQKVVPRSA